MKRCIGCDCELGADKFYRCESNPDGLTSRCRKCHRIYCQKHPDELAENQVVLLVDVLLRAAWVGQGHWGVPQYKGRVYYPLSIQRQMPHSDPRVQAQYGRQKGRCYYCQAKVGSQYQVDHVVPTSRFGENEAHNIVIACPKCNNAKGNKMPHEWPEGGRLF